MRYSRFRNQMEGPLGNRAGKKKAAKKAKDDLKAAMQVAPYVPPPETIPKMEPMEPKSEPMEPSFSTPPYVKPEFNSHVGPMDQSFHDTPDTYQMFQPMPRSYDSSSQQMAHNMPIGMPYHFPSQSPPMESQMSSMHYPSSNFGYSYPTYESADINIQDFGFQNSAYPNAPMTPMTPVTPIPWEPPLPVATPCESRPTPIKIEDDVEVLECKVKKVEIQNVAKIEF